jgi:tryptophan synthase alpha chain
MNRIKQLFDSNKNILSIYFTAGYPKKEDTTKVIKSLASQGVDLLEIGLPFSDPLADGPVIQESSTEALRNGMSSEVLFEQLKDIRNEVSVPLIIMGYFNPVMQYGVEAFCKKCNEVGIDGLILPDLPLEEYQEHYASVFEKYNLANIFLITPQTSDERIKAIDKASNAFIYLVSTASVTGSQLGFGSDQEAYFKRISDMNLENPLIVGFGIKDKQTFDQATKYTSGAIIGTAFINSITENGIDGIPNFIKGIRS